MSESIEPRLTGRKFKSYLHELLIASDWEERLNELNDISVKKLTTPLFSALFSNNPYLKWHAVSAFGITVCKNDYGAKSKCEEIIRRCMWNLNEESGNIPWGMPEVMAEIMANRKDLFDQFENILLSYISEMDSDDNYLDFDKLRTGAYWGIYRLTGIKPSFARRNANILYEALRRETLTENIIYLCLIFGKGKLFEFRSDIERLKKLDSEALVYIDKRLITLNIKEAAEISLADLEIY